MFRIFVNRESETKNDKKCALHFRLINRGIAMDEAPCRQRTQLPSDLPQVTVF